MNHKKKLRGAVLNTSRVAWVRALCRCLLKIGACSVGFRGTMGTNVGVSKDRACSVGLLGVL